MSPIADFLIFAALALSVFLSLVLIGKKNRYPADYALLAWLLVIACHSAFLFLGFHQIAEAYLLLQVLGHSLPVYHAPLVYLYVYLLLYGRLTWGKALAILWPIPLYLYVYCLLFLNGAVRAEGLQLYLKPSAPAYTSLLGPLMILLNVAYFVALLKMLGRHRKKIQDDFSFATRINLNWVRYWIYTFFIAALGITLALLSSDLGGLRLEFAYVFICGIFLVQLLIIGLKGLRQTDVFIEKSLYGALPKVKPQNPPAAATGSKKYFKSGQNQETITKQAQAIQLLMEKERLYLKPDLSLMQLAQASHIPKHQLSQIINEGLGLRFFDWVNGFRVATAQKKLLDPKCKHESILGIALDSGFGSKSSFNSIFKRYTGHTPTAYRKKFEQE